MTGSLAYSRGVLYVGGEERTAHVRSFDLDGRELEAAFSFRGSEDGAASVSGLAVDEDHRLWVADSVGGRLLSFTLFGDQVAEVGGAGESGHSSVFVVGDHDKTGVLGPVVDVTTRGEDDAQELLVAASGWRRHALQILPLGGAPARSLRSAGRVEQSFRDLSGVAWSGRMLWACERGAGRVQVFRDEDFHFAFSLEVNGGRRFLPTALAPLEGGRTLVAQGGEASALSLVDGAGRIIMRLAESGEGEGQVSEPGDLAIAEGEDDRHTRALVIDRDGTRVQVFNLCGDCYGTFPGFARSESSWEPS
jgi:hypothetical protein